MPVPIVSGGLYEIRVIGTQQGQAAINIFHFKEGEFNDPSEADTIQAGLTAFRAKWRLNILPKVSDSYAVFQYEIQSILDNRTPRAVPGPNDELYNIVYGSQFILGGEAADVGEIATAALPTCVAAGIRKVAATTERWGRGSWRLCGLVEADTEAVTCDQLTALRKASILANATAMLQVTVGETPMSLDMVVFGKTTWLKQANPSTPRDNYVSVVDSVVVNPFVTTQVSRKRRISLA